MTEYKEILPNHDGTGTFNGNDNGFHDDLIDYSSTNSPYTNVSSLPSNLSADLLDFFTDSDEPVQHHNLQSIQCLPMKDRVNRSRKRDKKVNADICRQCQIDNDSLESSLFASSAGLDFTPSRQLKCNHQSRFISSYENFSNSDSNSNSSYNLPWLLNILEYLHILPPNSINPAPINNDHDYRLGLRWFIFNRLSYLSN